MTKEITKAFILQEIQDKFGLRDFTPSKFVFEETVVPTYNIEEHLITNTARMSPKNIIAVGGMLFYLIGNTVRWYLSGYTVVFVSGSYTVSGVYIIRKNAPTSFLYLDLTAGQNTSYAHLLPRPITLDPGDIIGINIDGYTSTGELRLYIDYGIETIR